MELIDNLDKNAWTTGDPNVKTGFVEYRIAKGTKVQPGEYQYTCYDESGMLHNFLLKDGDKSCDPLHGVNVVELKIDDNGIIKGIIIADSDCAMCM